MSKSEGFDRGYRSEGGGLPVNMIKDYFGKQATPYNISCAKDVCKILNLSEADIQLALGNYLGIEGNSYIEIVEKNATRLYHVQDRGE